jgi:hypothetical protein
MATIGRAECKRRALLAADWFVNTQIVNKQPAFSADHGRIIYNYHLPSGLICRGLSWSHGRAIMCLLGAWELTGEQRYLDAAVRCGLYLRFALQVMDSRDRRIFGCFREEVPDSDYCYPRDAIEGAFGLLLLHLATGERDYLERCELFADWYLNFAMDRAARWPRGAVRFYDQADKFPLKFFQAGGATFFWHLYQLTGNKRYLRDGLFVLADGLIERFIDRDSGAMLSPTLDKHHAIEQGGKTVAINDDGASIALTCAHVATTQDSAKRQAGGTGGRTTADVRRNSKYLDAARAYADWIVNSCPRPIPLFAATGMHAITLTEVGELTGEAKYARFARELMAGQVRLQVLSPRKLDRHGAFRGEDEPVKWYVPGARPRDFVTTRCTAYATMALLRLHGESFGPSYSALGLDRFKRFGSDRRMHS